MEGQVNRIFTDVARAEEGWKASSKIHFLPNDHPYRCQTQPKCYIGMTLGHLFILTQGNAKKHS